MALVLKELVKDKKEQARIFAAFLLDDQITGSPTIAAEQPIARRDLTNHIISPSELFRLTSF